MIITSDAQLTNQPTTPYLFSLDDDDDDDDMFVTYRVGRGGRFKEYISRERGREAEGAGGSRGRGISLAPLPNPPISHTF